ncbi:maleylpyruvate isomerase family mycothiol-dependent enzyme [Mycobacterium sp. MUNTM1]
MDGLAAFALVAESTRRFVESVARLSDAEVGGATLIPPWTRGHVITHVARAADSYCRLLAGATEGLATPQYPSMEFRAEQIEAGAGRSVDELVSDVTASSDRFEQAMRSLPAHAWRAKVRMRPGELRAPAVLPLIRQRELEVHHVDLAVGYRFSDIAAETAGWIIDDILMELQRRDPVPALAIKATDTGLTRELGVGAPLISGTQADILAWLSGRSNGAGLSSSGGNEVPLAAYWI